MLFIGDKDAKSIVASLKGHQEEDFERNAKEAIPVVEAFLLVPPGEWSAKHSREWKSAFTSEPDNSCLRDVPPPPLGMSDHQRRMLEVFLASARRETLEDRFDYAMGRVSAGDSIEDALRSAKIKKNLTRLAAAFREKFPQQKKPAVQ